MTKSMKTVKTFARQFSFSLMMAMTLGSAVVSCDSILGEEEVDCSVEYRVKFKYDYNMKYADAFSREDSPAVTKGTENEASSFSPAKVTR